MFSDSTKTSIPRWQRQRLNFGLYTGMEHTQWERCTYMIKDRDFSNTSNNLQRPKWRHKQKNKQLHDPKDKNRSKPWESEKTRELLQLVGTKKNVYWEEVEKFEEAKCLERCWTKERSHSAHSSGLEAGVGGDKTWMHFLLWFSNIYKYRNWKVGLLTLERNTSAFWTIHIWYLLLYCSNPISKSGQGRRWLKTIIHSLGLEFNYFFFQFFCIK